MKIAPESEGPHELGIAQGKSRSGTDTLTVKQNAAV